MGERVKQFIERVRVFFAGLSKRLKAVLALILILTIAVIVGLSIYRSTRPYTILFRELSSSDMSLVMTYLSENNVTDFKVQSNNTILVREDQEAALKAAIYQQGYPTSGFGYDTYLNNVGVLSSQSDRETLKIYDLQDRLGAVIRLMDNVIDAYVTINTGSDTSYILSDNVQKATATVSVTMRTGSMLTDGQVTAIRNAVSNAVEGLDVTDVKINDQSGNTYNAGSGAATISDTASLKLALEEQVNANTRERILEVLIPLFGRNNVNLSVNSTVDVSHKYVDDLLYYLPEYAADGSTNGQGIIGSRVWGNYLIRGTDTATGGVVGTSTNADLNEYVVREGDLTGTESEINTSGEINYNTSRTQTQSETLGGTITDLTVSVVINSSIFENSDYSSPNVQTLIPAVARAAGITTEYESDKISIVLAPFYVPPAEVTPVEPEEPGGFFDNLPPWALYALIGGSALFVLLLILIIILSARRRKKKKNAQKLEKQQALDQLTPNMMSMSGSLGELNESGADIMGINMERTMELRKDVRQFAEDNPAIAAQMVKNWLRGSEES